MIPVVKKWGALLLLGGILCLSLPLRGQSARVGTITGRVTNAHTGEPLPFANVFLTNTTLGTTTDADGRFTLRNLPLGTVEVGASFVGFTFVRRSVRLASSEPLVLDVALIPSSVALQGVEVKAKRRKPGRYYEQFRREFLGTTSFARQCEIENPEVLAYEKSVGTLKVSAREPLRVVNRALGYEILFFLEAFQAQRDQVRFVGNPKFTELEPKDASQAASWAKNRRSAYFASIRYLLRLLVEGRWEEEGYLMVEVNAFHADGSDLLYPYIGRNFNYLDPAKVVLPGKLPFERRLRIDKPVEVFNLKKYNSHSPYRDVRHDHARLVFKDVPLDVTTDGWAYNPTGLLVTGFLALDRVANMLPRDYEPEGMPAVTDRPLAARRLPLFDTLANRLRKLPRQQLYLHHDKHYYWSGNTVWLSAYLTDAATGDLYPDDQLLHAELVSPAGKVLTAVKLKAEMGRAAGQFHLPDTAATGVYRLRAYTNWMQKVPGSYLYDQPLVVYNLRNPGMTARAGSAGKGNGPAPQAPNPPVTVRFYPEGGRLLEGISGVAGIRATGPDGSGVALRGRLFDDLGGETAAFATDATGLGKVAFQPLPGRTYRAEVWDGIQAAIHLPPVHREGFALWVDNQPPDQVRVRVDQAGAPAADSLLLVVQHRRTLVHTAQLVPAAGGIDLAIPKAKLPPGVNRLVLFDRKGRLHAQRLVYREPALPPFRIRVDGPVGGPGPREKVALELTISDSTGNPVEGSFSLSVTDARQQPADSLRRTLASNQWLMAEMADYVEAPHRYLSPGAAGATDLLMLVQSPGWSSWPGLLEQSPPVPVLDDYFMTVSGRVTDPKGKKLLPGHRVIMLSADTTYPHSHQAFTDSAGRFRFPRLDFSDTIRVSFLVYNPQGRTAPALVTLDPAASPGGPADPYPAYLLRRYWPQAEENRPREAARSGLALDKVQQLQEVVVKGRKKPKPTPADAHFTLTSLVADYVRNFGEDSYAYTSIYQMLARVPGLQVSMSGNGTSGIVRVRGFGSFGTRNTPSGAGEMASSYSQASDPLFLLDDVPLMDNPSMVLDGINPSEVSRIEVITGAGGAAFGARGGNGVISIYLKTFADYDKEARSRQAKKYVLAGYLTPKPLPMPDYGGPEADRAAPDQRDVLYWNPLLRTDEAGNATVQFYNSDQADRLLVVLEGITATGQPVSFSTVISKQ